MTKDEMISSIWNAHLSNDSSEMADAINRLFSQNVVIPKNSQLQEFADGRWLDLCYISENCEYRIKPEPVYEWQWYIVFSEYNGSEPKLSQFLTDEEYLRAFQSKESMWTKIEASKRVRE